MRVSRSPILLPEAQNLIIASDSIPRITVLRKIVNQRINHHSEINVSGLELSKYFQWWVERDGERGKGKCTLIGDDRVHGLREVVESDRGALS